jgi:hypothetical protein
MELLGQLNYSKMERERTRMPDIHIGDAVELLGLPAWLIHDLPESERHEMRGYVGRISLVVDIDAHGCFWLGFGETVEAGLSANYQGHSFCVPADFIELVKQPGIL